MAKLVDRHKIRQEILKKQEEEILKTKNDASTTPSNQDKLKSKKQTGVENRVGKNFQKIVSLVKKGWSKIKKETKKSFLVFFNKEKWEKVYKKINKGADKVNVKIDKFLLKIKNALRASFGKVGKLFFKIRLGLLIGILIAALASNLQGLNNRFDENNLITRKINFYPLSPFEQLEFAKTTFDNGNQDITNYFIAKNDEALELWKAIGLGKYFEEKIKQTKHYIETPKRKVAYAERINKEKETVPYSWQVLVKEAEIEAELYKQKELEKTLALISWINPKFDKNGFIKSIEEE